MDVTVIIRSVGERTTDLCRQIIEAQVDKGQVFVIQERPHANAVRKTLELGLKYNRKWTLAVDADVLFFDNAITELITSAEQIGARRLKKLLVFQGNVYCKLFGKPRPGFHLYNTAMLPKALEEQPKAADNVRPESTIWNDLSKKGYLRYIDDKIYALHAFEQSNQDCLKNGFFQAEKHLHAIPKMLPYWKQKMEADQDYALFIKGFKLNIEYRGEVKVDKAFFDEVLSGTETNEKEALDSSFIAELNQMREGILNEHQKRLKPRVFPASESLLRKKLLLKLSRFMLRKGRTLEEDIYRM